MESLLISVINRSVHLGVFLYLKDGEHFNFFKYQCDFMSYFTGFAAMRLDKMTITNGGTPPKTMILIQNG